MGDHPTAREQTYLDALPATDDYAASLLGLSESTIRDYRSNLSDKGYEFATNAEDEYTVADAPEDNHDYNKQDNGNRETDLPDLSDVEPEGEPEPKDLSDRQRVIATELQSGSTVDDLADELGERRTIVTEHIRDLKRQGWNVYIDETAEHVGIEGDQPLRSSEHKGTRTRKANRWWETRHNSVQRRYDALETPTIDPQTITGNEDWVTHMTDLHAGDEVRGYDDGVVHQTEELPGIIDHITQRSIALAEKHNSTYDVAYLLWGGDFVTNEAIYEGQFEDLDAWLDEQIDIMHDPLLKQIKAFSERFDAVKVIGTPGNHGDIRASGSSKQANADLILYKGLRNTVGALQMDGSLENVGFEIGYAGKPYVFDLRGGEIHGQLRHGQDRKPQAETSARLKEWYSTILDSLNYGDMVDMIWMGHHHVSGRIPWNGPPIFVTGTPKPGGDYARELGKMSGPSQPDIATCHGVSDQGITGVYPVDTRNYE
ncbi:YonJ-like protein [environmental Halophage eHP-1]|nr:YonJ-like protein [environmental Halophage eHP-1]AFH22233.1 YonJ-like protein [environmental Halophage eHP-19]